MVVPHEDGKRFSVTSSHGHKIGYVRVLPLAAFPINLLFIPYHPKKIAQFPLTCLRVCTCGVHVYRSRAGRCACLCVLQV